MKAPWTTTLMLQQYFEIKQSNNAEVDINLGRVVRATVANISVPANGRGTVPISFAINATLGELDLILGAFT